MGEEKLAGGTAWIGGGGSGTGAATARLFARHGARVAIADVDKGGGEAVAAEISSVGGEAVFQPCDVRREAEVRDARDAFVAAGRRARVSGAGSGMSPAERS